MSSINYNGWDVPIVSGLVNGALSYVTGLLLSVGLFAVLGMQPIAQLASSAIPRPGEMFGWLFYGAHQVPVVVDGEPINYASTIASNSAVYYAVPVILLAASGYHVAENVEATEPTAGFVAGATTTLGYLPLALGGIVLFTYEASQVTVTIPFLRAILLVGLAYPIVAGGIGGVLATR